MGSIIFLVSATSIAKKIHLPGLEKSILAAKLKTFLFHTSKIEGPVLKVKEVLAIGVISQK